MAGDLHARAIERSSPQQFSKHAVLGRAAGVFGASERQHGRTETLPARADRGLLAIGAVIAAGGFYFMLVGLSLVPPPSHSDAPGWIAFCAGLVFFCAGISVLVRGFLGLSDKVADLPADTPVAIKAIYALSGLILVASLACIGTWIAIGSGPRQFSMSGPISGTLGENIGRAMFGFGAIVTWLIVIAMARTSAKKIFSKKS